MPNYTMTRVVNPSSFTPSAAFQRQNFNQAQRTNRGNGLAEAMQSIGGWIDGYLLDAEQKEVFDSLQFEIEKALGGNVVGGALVALYRYQDPSTGRRRYTFGALLGVGFTFQSAYHEYLCGKRKSMGNHIELNIMTKEYYWIQKTSPNSVNMPSLSKGIFTENAKLKSFDPLTN